MSIIVLQTSVDFQNALEEAVTLTTVLIRLLVKAPAQLIVTDTGYKLINGNPEALLAIWIWTVTVAIALQITGTASKNLPFLHHNMTPI